MSDFQKFLDDNLMNVQIEHEGENSLSVEPYDIYQEIRDAMIAVRRENHLTQKELADKTGLTQSSISNIENGSSKPTIDSLKKIADATGTRLVIDFLRQEVE